MGQVSLDIYANADQAVGALKRVESQVDKMNASMNATGGSQNFKNIEGQLTRIGEHTKVIASGMAGMWKEAPKLGEGLKTALDALTKLGEGARSALRIMIGEFKKSREQNEAFKKAMDDIGKSVANMPKAMGSVQAAVNATTDTTKNFAKSNNNVAAAVDKVKSKYDTVASAVASVATELRRMKADTENAKENAASVPAAFNNLVAAIQNLQKGVASLVSHINRMARMLRDTSIAVKETAKSQEKVQKATEKTVDAARKAAEEAKNAARETKSQETAADRVYKKLQNEQVAAEQIRDIGERINAGTLTRCQLEDMLNDKSNKTFGIMKLREAKIRSEKQSISEMTSEITQRLNPALAGSNRNVQDTDSSLERFGERISSIAQAQVGSLIVGWVGVQGAIRAVNSEFQTYIEWLEKGKKFGEDKQDSIGRVGSKTISNKQYEAIVSYTDTLYQKGYFASRKEANEFTDTMVQSGIKANSEEAETLARAMFAGVFAPSEAKQSLMAASRISKKSGGKLSVVDVLNGMIASSKSNPSNVSTTGDAIQRAMESNDLGFVANATMIGTAAEISKDTEASVQLSAMMKEIKQKGMTGMIAKMNGYKVKEEEYIGADGKKGTRTVVDDKNFQFNEQELIRFLLTVKTVYGEEELANLFGNIRSMRGAYNYTSSSEFLVKMEQNRKDIEASVKNKTYTGERTDHILNKKEKQKQRTMQSQNAYTERKAEGRAGLVELFKSQLEENRSQGKLFGWYKSYIEAFDTYMATSEELADETLYYIKQKARNGEKLDEYDKMKVRAVAAYLYTDYTKNKNMPRGKALKQVKKDIGTTYHRGNFSGIRSEGKQSDELTSLAEDAVTSEKNNEENARQDIDNYNQSIDASREGEKAKAQEIEKKLKPGGEWNKTGEAFKKDNADRIDSEEAIEKAKEDAEKDKSEDRVRPPDEWWRARVSAGDGPKGAKMDAERKNAKPGDVWVNGKWISMQKPNGGDNVYKMSDLVSVTNLIPDESGDRDIILGNNMDRVDNTKENSLSKSFEAYRSSATNADMDHVIVQSELTNLMQQGYGSEESLTNMTAAYSEGLKASGASEDAISSFKAFSEELISAFKNNEQNAMNSKKFDMMIKLLQQIAQRQPAPALSNPAPDTTDPDEILQPGTTFNKFFS